MNFTPNIIANAAGSAERVRIEPKTSVIRGCLAIFVALAFFTKLLVESVILCLDGRMYPNNSFLVPSYFLPSFGSHRSQYIMLDLVSTTIGLVLFAMTACAKRSFHISSSSYSAPLGTLFIVFQDIWCHGLHQGWLQRPPYFAALALIGYMLVRADDTAVLISYNQQVTPAKQAEIAHAGSSQLYQQVPPQIHVMHSHETCPSYNHSDLIAFTNPFGAKGSTSHQEPALFTQPIQIPSSGDVPPIYFYPAVPLVSGNVKL